jgi:hypothetical protein
VQGNMRQELPGLDLQTALRERAEVRENDRKQNTSPLLPHPHLHPAHAALLIVRCFLCHIIWSGFFADVAVIFVVGVVNDIGTKWMGRKLTATE